MDATPFGDKYLLVEHIATGGMAEIYRAQYTGIEGFAKELVVKRLREEFARRPEVVQMFLNEAKVAATLTHNNIVHTYDLGEIAGEYYIAMELLKGEELVSVLRRGVSTGKMIPRELAMGVTLQALEGLHYAHERRAERDDLGIVHRDINPTNVYVGYDGVCKIVDFGIAATRATAMRSTHQFAGKLSYMAPEQMRGEQVDRRADIYPMGVMLYEMSLGRRLFRGTPEEVRRRVLEGDIPAPTFIDPDFPPALEAIILRALELDPENRYQNCDHMFRELETYMRSEGLTCTPRQISAYMSELFGEGAPAQVEYDDLYDDVVDEVLDFDQMDEILRGAEAESAPWADMSEAFEEVDAGRRGRRTMTIGSLAAYVEDIRDEAPPSGDNSRRGRDANRKSGHHPVVAGGNPPAGEVTRPPSREVPAVRPPSRPRSGRHPTVPPTEGSHSPTGNFGQAVMSEQGKPSNPLIWVFLLAGLTVVAYFVTKTIGAK